MKFLSAFLLFGLFIACNGNKYTQTTVPAEDEDIVDIPDTLIIDQNLVVFWWPDSIEQIKMRESFDEISYNKFVDDLTWYTERTVEMLDSAGINNRITDRDVIIFKSKNKGNIELKRKEIKGNMVLLRKDKDPVVTNMTSFDRKEVISYFE